MKHLDEIKKLGIRTFDNLEIESVDYKYIDVFYTGIESVEHRFLVDNTPSANKEGEVIETSYTSRLVSKINLLFEAPDNNPCGLDCVGPEKKGLYKIGEEENMIVKHPDIVVHKGENPLEGYQEIVCEIKNLSYLGASEMIYDLNKLISYCSPSNWGNPYRIAIFLVYNCTKERLIKHVSGYRNQFYFIENLLSSEESQVLNFSEFVNTHRNQLNNILCFCHSQEGYAELCTMYEIVESKIHVLM